MAIAHCPECGKKISTQTKTCDNCGFPLDQSNEQNTESRPLVVECPECGKSVSHQAKICNNCGFPLELSTVQSSSETIIPISSSTDNTKQRTNVQITQNRKRKAIVFLIILVAGIATLIIVKTKSPKGTTQISHEETTLDLNNVKEKLSTNTEYVKEHIIGTWKTSDGTILEIHSNGFMVNYTPQQDKSLDTESFLTSEIKSTGYNGYTIPDTSSYSESDLQAYSTYLNSAKRTDKIGVSLQMNYYGVLSDKFVLFEFKNDNSLRMGDIDLIRVSAEEPDISDEITGLYINEKDKTLSLEVIEVKNTNIGYFEWNTTNDGLEGSCRISNDKIVLSFPYADDFVFGKQGSNLIEIGSNELQGSNLQYKKISNLSYCGQVNKSQVSDIENTSDDRAPSEESTSSSNETEYLTLDNKEWDNTDPYPGNNQYANSPSIDNSNFDNKTNESKDEFVEYKIGDTISFGDYIWKILDIVDNKALITTEYVIERRPYNDELKEITWENCSLREYLNNEFYNSFTEREKDTIIEVTNENPDNQKYNIPGGNPTKDKVFVLSIDEANRYDTAIPRYVLTDMIWWLRSPGDEKTGAAGQYDCGSINEEGYYVDGYGGVRPVCWIKINN